MVTVTLRKQLLYKSPIEGVSKVNLRYFYEVMRTREAAYKYLIIRILSNERVCMTGIDRIHGYPIETPTSAALLQLFPNKRRGSPWSGTTPSYYTWLSTLKTRYNLR